MGQTLVRSVQGVSDAASFNDLPYDVLLKIFGFLDFRAQRQLRRVSKSWQDILSSEPLTSQLVIDLNVSPDWRDKLPADDVFWTKTRKLVVLGHNKLVCPEEESTATEAFSRRKSGFPRSPAHRKWAARGKTSVIEILVLDGVEVHNTSVLDNVIPSSVHTLCLRNVIIGSVTAQTMPRYPNYNPEIKSATMALLSIKTCAQTITPQQRQAQKLARRKEVHAKLLEIVELSARPPPDDEIEKIVGFLGNNLPTGGWWWLNNVVKGWEPNREMVSLQSGVPSLKSLKPATLGEICAWVDMWAQDPETLRRCTNFCKNINGEP